MLEGERQKAGRKVGGEEGKGKGGEEKRKREPNTHPSAGDQRQHLQQCYDEGVCSLSGMPWE